MGAEINDGISGRHELEFVHGGRGSKVGIIRFGRWRSEGKIVCHLVDEWVAARGKETSGGSFGWTCPSPSFPNILVTIPVRYKIVAKHVIDAFG